MYWVDLGEDSGRRPAVILTRTKLLARLDNVTVAPLTTHIRNLDTEVEVEIIRGRRSVVSLDNINTIRKTSLRSKITSLADDQMQDVFGAIHAAFDMPF